MDIEHTVSILAGITTRDESGTHFTMSYPAAFLQELEEAGLIEVSRPVHETGIPYSQDYWMVEVTQDGCDLVDIFLSL